MSLGIKWVERLRPERRSRRIPAGLLALALCAPGLAARAEPPAEAPPALTVGRVARGILTPKDPATRDGWRSALRDPRPELRAAAARAITVTGSPLADDVAAALAVETDKVALKEEFRALVTLRPPSGDADLVRGLKTPERATAAAAVLGRARGAAAFAHLPALRAAGLADASDMAQSALAGGDYDGVTAAALATGDSDAWKAVLTEATASRARLSETTLASALRSPAAGIREATLWSLVVAAAERKDLAEPLRTAAFDSGPEPPPGEAAARELLSRALGRPARDLPQWVSALGARAALPPPDVSGYGPTLALLKPVELSALSLAVTGKRKGLADLLKPPYVSAAPRITPSISLFTLGGLPPGYARAVLTETSCHPKKDLVGSIEVVYGADGRPRNLGPMKDDVETPCREAITVLGASGLAPDSFVVPAGRPVALLMLLQPEALACGDAASSDRSPSQGARPSSSIRAPKKVRDALPVYPPEAELTHPGGVVILEAFISSTGCISGLRLLRSPDPVFVWPAMRAVAQWRYTPTLLDGEPVPVTMTVTMNFRR